MLAIFNLDQKIILETNTLDYALRVCINQLDKKGRLYLVAFYSRKFTLAKLNYNMHDKELLVVIEAFNQQKHYLIGLRYQVIVYLDYKNLTVFITTK